MDLFNRKKVAALQKELELATASKEATAKELADLRENVMKSYDSLTDYFKPRYLNKYFKYTTQQDEIRIKCLDLKYSGGYVEMSSQLNNGSVVSLVISVPALKNLTVITKKDFIGEEAAE